MFCDVLRMSSIVLHGVGAVAPVAKLAELELMPLVLKLRSFPVVSVIVLLTLSEIVLSYILTT